MITGRRTAVGLWIVYFTDERVDDLNSRIYIYIVEISVIMVDLVSRCLIIAWASVKQTNCGRYRLCRKLEK